MRSDDVSYSTPPTPDSDPGNRLEISAATPSTTSSYDFVFDPADGDIELQASGKCVIEGPFDFDTPTLVSALRVATVYRYDGLRQFSISKLEKAKLSAIQRIKIAQELDVTHWTQPAFEELANRTEAIQPDEARILGIDALLLVSNMREERRARRGNGASTIVSETDTALAGCRAQESPRADLTRDGQSDVDGDTIYHLPDVDDDLLGEGSKTCFIGAPFPPYGFIFPINQDASDSKSTSQVAHARTPK
ncbi:hypothetical protein OPQ81_009451 [Rhizoctonia solani]|nr:hypothetical protein OPQ81_009451 [Rhizoctonia solani]